MENRKIIPFPVTFRQPDAFNRVAEENCQNVDNACQKPPKYYRSRPLRSCRQNKWRVIKKERRHIAAAARLFCWLVY